MYHKNWELTTDIYGEAFKEQARAGYKLFMKRELDDRYKTLLDGPLASIRQADEVQWSCEVWNLLEEWMWVKLGRPIWRLHPELLPFLENIKLDVTLDSIHLPSDVVCINFPLGTMVEGVPVRNAMFCQIRSKLGTKLLRRFSNEFTKTEFETRRIDDHGIRVMLDFGEEAGGVYSANGPRRLQRYMWLDISMGLEKSIEHAISTEHVSPTLEVQGKSSLSQERGAMCYGLRMGLAAMLYVQSVREEGLTVVSTSRAPKKPKPGKLGTPAVSDVKLTRKLLTTIQRLERSTTAGGSDRKGVRPHLRGWTLRVLRHERYKRNEDGSCKTVLVEPMLIGAKTIDDIEDQGTAEVRKL